jgi:hypothetical protein
MADFGQLFGKNGILEQLLLWGIVGEILSTMGGPALTALQQDINAAHPLLALPPSTAADAVARQWLSAGSGRSEAAKGGIDAGRFDTLTRLAQLRLDPATLAQLVVRGIASEGAAQTEAGHNGLAAADFKGLLELAPLRLPPEMLAQAVTRTFTSEGFAEAQARLQGMDKQSFTLALDLAKVHLPPEILAQAVERTFTGAGPAEHEAQLQGLAPQWFTILRDLARVHLPPEVLAQAVDRTFLAEGQAAHEAELQGLAPQWFAVLRELAAVHLPPATLAQATQHNLMPAGEAAAEARVQGIDGAMFGILRELETVRLAPADLATAVLRSYLTDAEAQKEATPQGVSPEMLKILADLAGDAPGPDQLVQALFRKIIPEAGRGANSISYEQGIAETRLHNKWGKVLHDLGIALLSPPDAASAVIRNFMPLHDAEAEAAKTGVTPELFAILRHLAGDAPGPQQLAEALRRKAIPQYGKGPDSISFTQGIAEGRLADKWAPVIEALAKLWPTPVDALEAALKGQISPDEGKRLYELLGGDLQFYTWLLNSQGEGPSPLQAADWARRGIIPWQGTGPQVTSYEQAVKESRFRDKWTNAYRASVAYVPPPETVRTLLEQGAINEQQAVAYWKESGLTQATIEAYLHAAAFNNTAATRGLAINEVLNLFYAQIIGEIETAQLLDLFHVPKHTASLLIQYTLVRRDITATTKSVARISTLLASRKIGIATARQALERLRIPNAAIDGLLQDMELSASINVKVLTESQIADAWAAAIITQDEAMAELRAIGYTPYDAWIVLSIKAKTAIPNKPPREVAPAPGNVIPGTT